MNLPEQYLKRMELQLGSDRFRNYLEEMRQHPVKSLRINTLKTTVEAFLRDQDLQPNGIIPEGFLVPEDYPVGQNPRHAAGLFYMQEASAQYPASLLNVLPGETVLDLCAAPGGKTGQLAAAMQSRGILVANEISPKRATVLDSTLERLGVRNAVITNMRPDRLCPPLAKQFDAVLVDAPCSGEGMFRKDPQAVSDWSEEHVLACAERQAAILNSVAETVKPGGRLVYSTCTFSEAENENVVSGFLSGHPDFRLAGMKRLYPFDCAGEGQFAALIIREDGPSAPSLFRPASGSDRKTLLPFLDYLSENSLPVRFSSVKALPDGRVFILPDTVPDHKVPLHVLRTGVFAGEIKNGRFIPSHCLYMSYPASCFASSVELSEEEQNRFLSGETLPCSSSLKGYTAVCCGGHPIGFGKAVGGVMKNHLPKGLRIHKS